MKVRWTSERMAIVCIGILVVHKVDIGVHSWWDIVTLSFQIVANVVLIIISVGWLIPSRSDW